MYRVPLTLLNIFVYKKIINKEKKKLTSAVAQVEFYPNFFVFNTKLQKKTDQYYKNARI